MPRVSFNFLGLLFAITMLTVASVHANSVSMIELNVDHDWTTHVGGATFGIRGCRVVCDQMRTNVYTELVCGSRPVWAGSPFLDGGWRITIQLPFHAIAALVLPSVLLAILFLIFILRFLEKRLFKNDEIIPSMRCI